MCEEKDSQSGPSNYKDGPDLFFKNKNPFSRCCPRCRCRRPHRSPVPIAATILPSQGFVGLIKEDEKKEEEDEFVEGGVAKEVPLSRLRLHWQEIRQVLRPPQQLHDEERHELQAKSLRTTVVTPATPSTGASAASIASTVAAPSEERQMDDLVLPRAEVIHHLRLLKQPITLVGEDDGAKLDQLKLTLKASVFEVDIDMTEG